MALGDRIDELVRGLPRGWEHARIELTVDDEDADRAAVLLAPATPGRSGSRFAIHVAGAGASGTSPSLAHRVLARLDEAGIAGRLRLAEADRPKAAPEERTAQAAARAPLALAWDAELSRLPRDWSDLYAEIELDSSDYLDRGALLLAPINPARAGGPASLRFRAASRKGYGAAVGMTRRAFERLDDEGLSGRIRILRVLSDTSHPHSQGPVWREDGHAV